MMIIKKKIKLRSACFVLFIFVFSFLADDAFSQVDDVSSRKLIVGSMVLPPLFEKVANNQWVGFSAEISQAVADEMGVRLEFKEFDSLDSMINALKKNEIDVIPSLQVRDRFESIFDFSNSYLKSGLSIAVSTESQSYDLFKIFGSVLSGDNFKAIMSLILVSLIAGTIIWFFERRHASKMFYGNYIQGICKGIWWAMVTMTTVGYGDKAPKTIGGRSFALLWMVFSIIFISCFTAIITSQLTISKLNSKVNNFNDLYNVKVGCVFGSEAFDYLTKRGVPIITFKSVQEGLSAVDNRKIDAFVQDEIMLKHLVKSNFPGRMQVVGGTFDEYFVSIALPLNSPLRKPINKALQEIMKSPGWAELMNHYIK